MSEFAISPNFQLHRVYSMPTSAPLLMTTVLSLVTTVLSQCTDTTTTRGGFSDRLAGPWSASATANGADVLGLVNQLTTLSAFVTNATNITLPELNVTSMNLSEALSVVSPWVDVEDCSRLGWWRLARPSLGSSATTLCTSATLADLDAQYGFTAAGWTSSVAGSTTLHTICPKSCAAFGVSADQSTCPTTCQDEPTLLADLTPSLFASMLPWVLPDASLRSGCNLIPKMIGVVETPLGETVINRFTANNGAELTRLTNLFTSVGGDPASMLASVGAGSLTSLIGSVIGGSRSVDDIARETFRGALDAIDPDIGRLLDALPSATCGANCSLLIGEMCSLMTIEDLTEGMLVSTEQLPSNPSNLPSGGTLLAEACGATCAAYGAKVCPSPPPTSPPSRPPPPSPLPPSSPAPSGTLMFIIIGAGVAAVVLVVAVGGYFYCQRGASAKAAPVSSMEMGKLDGSRPQSPSGVNPRLVSKAADEPDL